MLPAAADEPHRAEDVSAASWNPRPGDDIVLGAHRLLVTGVGTRPHSGGYGPVDLLALDLSDRPYRPGTIVNSPWGSVEVLDPRLGGDRPVRPAVTDRT